MPRNTTSNRLTVRNHNSAIYNRGTWYFNGNSAGWTTPYSLECFFKTRQLTPGAIFSNRNAGANLLWGVNNGVLYGFAAPSGAINGSRLIADGYWHHVVITMSGAVANMYVDGVLDGAANQACTLPNTTETFRLFLEPDGSNELFGSIQDFRRYNKVLNLQEIQDSYFNNVVPSGLIDRFKFDDGFAVTPVNSAGGALSGTLRNVLMSTTESFMKSRVAGSRNPATGRVAIT